MFRTGGLVFAARGLQLTAQSWPPPTLRPAGPFAAPLAEITWVMLAVGVAVFVVVAIVLWIALRGGEMKRAIGGTRTVIIGGFVFPVVVLSASLVYGLWTTARLVEPPPPGEMRIRVIGETWWWRVLYLDGDRILFETANEIRIPVRTPVSFELESADVIHSFWVPELAAKLDMIPGRRTLVRAQADQPGIYRGSCTEYCGAAHALMGFEVIALDPEAFARWREAQAAPALTPAQGAGRRLFDEVGCGACHAVRGQAADGALGPDLTHFATRRTLGAGVLINDPVTLRLWIEHAGELKPGVRMPSYEQLSQEEIESLALYLESLR